MIKSSSIAALVIFGTASVLTAGVAFAQYAGPGAAPVVKTVSEVVSSAKDDTLVEIDGHIVKQLSSDKFLFSDGKAQVRVEIDKEILPKVAFDQRAKVRIRGEVEKDFLQSPEIDVSHIEVLAN